MTIDWWTLGFQAINVLVLVWLLGHFFWKPVAAMIAQRRAAAQQMLTDAKARQDQATAALADIERTRAGFAQEREAILVQAQAEAERARSAVLEAAAKDAATLAAAAQATADKEKAATADAWRRHATELAVDIAGRLCAPLAGPAVQAVFIERLLDKVRGLPETERRTIGTSAVALEAVSALPLGPDDEGRLRDRLADAIGAAPQLVFRTDAALLAGLELHSPHLSVSNSWRADLQQIQREVAHDGA